MNIKTQRYGVILKLTVMLAFLGCFFIANGRTVKAAGTAADITNFSTATGLSCSINTESGHFDTSDKLGFYFGNDKSKYIVKDLTTTNFTADNKYSITKEAILQAAAERGITLTDHEVPIYYAVYTGTEEPADGTLQLAGSDIKTNAIYKATKGSSSLSSNVTMGTSTSDKAKSGSDGFYCYRDGIVTYEYALSALAASDRLTGWTVNGTSVPLNDPKWVGLIYTYTITDSNVEVVPEVTAKAITSITYTPTDKYLKAGVVSTQEYTLETNADVGTIDWSKANFTVTYGVGKVSYNGTTSKLEVSSKAETVKPSISVKVSVPHGNHDGSAKEETLVFKVYESISGVNLIIFGDKNCVKGTTTGAYKIYKVVGNVKTEFPADDIAKINWKVSAYDGATANRLQFGGTSDTYDTINPITDPTLTAAANAVNNDVYKLTAVVTDQFGNTKTLNEYVIIGDGVGNLRFVYREYEITKGYNQAVDVKSSPPDALTGFPIVFTKSSSTDKTFTISKQGSGWDDYGYWEAIIHGDKAGNTGEIVANASGSGVVSTSASVIVYNSPKETLYTPSTRTLSIVLPEELHLGVVKEDGEYVDSEIDYDAVTGYSVDITKDGKSLISSSSASTYDKPEANTTGNSTTATLSSTNFEKIIENNKSKFSGDVDNVNLTVKFYGTGDSDDPEIIPDTDGRDMVKSFDVPVYKVAIVGDSGLSSTTAYTYGLEGQEVSLAASVKSGYKITGWSDSTSYTSSTRKVTVSSDTSKNKYTVNTANSSSTSTSSSSSTSRSTGSGSDDSYDPVPKTSESNTPIWLIIFMVFAVIGSGYALYMQLAPVKTDSEESDDEDE